MCSTEESASACCCMSGIGCLTRRVPRGFLYSTPELRPSLPAKSLSILDGHRKRTASAQKDAHAARCGCAARTSNQVGPKAGPESTHNRQHRIPGAILGQPWDSPYGTMTVSELPMQLQLFCDREGMAHTAMSDDTPVHVGTRITIWAENSHISLGSAFAHPNVHGRERYDACRAQLRFCQLV